MAGRKPIIVMHEGQELTLKQLAAATGIPYHRLWYRHRMGKTGEALVAVEALPSGRRQSWNDLRTKGLM